VSGPREEIFSAVVEKLESIRMTNDYACDVDAVYRVDVLPDDMPAGVKRALCVLESLTPEAWEFLDSGASGGQDSKLTVVIAGVVKSPSTDLKSSQRHTDLNELINATTKALMQDPTFARTCKQSVLSGPLAMVDTDKGEALFNMNLRCRYQFAYADL